MKPRKFTIIVEEDDDGFVVECPEFQGCYTQAETYEKALDNIRDLIRVHLDRGEAAGSTQRHLRSVAVRTVEVEA